MAPKKTEDEKSPERKRKRKTKTASADGASSPAKKAAAKKPRSPRKSKKEETAGSPKKSPKKKKAPAHQVLTARDDIPKLWTPEQASKNGSYTMKIASWNVAGLRALLRKAPEALPELVKRHDIDVLCLQEHKLQETHLDDPKLKIRGHLLEEEGYDSYYSCSTAKKGYSGTAVFVKRRSINKGSGGSKKQKTMDSFLKPSTSKPSMKDKSSDSGDLPIDAKLLIPESVSYKMGVSKHDTEGRLVSVDFPSFSMVNCYIPNAGQKLERLAYRTKEWDKDFLEYMQKKQKDRAKPVMWLGDLNIAHTNLEVWNDGAKHLPKQAGVTVEERESFQDQLDAGFIDAFRKLHPEAKGHYSYWSQRAGNREPNKGLRLDYFVCSPEFFEEDSSVAVKDSYILHDVEGSDHCPVVLELEIS